ncbi:phytanoyl-CoA dioxygenase family protein [Novosphingobium sp. G106]|uniref:phytanoyl-CoA dioxygenase family protein n=1 Tax=Novosphingobium sp. G106 TaxID=2849500 RepID=UPI001C2D214F|nr:phytanoyl-CoA dioxygenase family protein [Novosphingobium sp. G106]MBV1686414.1 phytanoyl-CoA dioxygenase family protein [Novosphingobium sp. G106]
MDIRANDQTSSLTRQLLDDGYCIAKGVVPTALVTAISDDFADTFAITPHSIGSFYGNRTKRFHGLLRRSLRTEHFVLQPLITELVESVLGPHCERVQLNLTQAIEIEANSEAQAPHRDQDMWPIHAQGVEYLVNVMWPFTPYTAQNGATRIWPGSHRRQNEMLIGEEDAVAVEMNPGDALIFLGSTLHGGGANSTALSRKGMIISYSLGWLKPYELPWLAYPPEFAKTLSQPLADLAGYRAHRPNLGTYEGRCPSTLLEAEGSSLGAVDSLRDDQEALILAWREGRLTVA